MDPAILALARCPAKITNEGLTSRRQLVKDSFNGIEGFEPVRPLGAGAKLPRALGAPQHQYTEDSERSRTEAPCFIEHMAVFLCPAGDHGAGKASGSQEQHGVSDSALAVVDDGITAGLLVACVGERIGRQRVLIGRRRLLLDQNSENANFLCRELHTRTVVWTGLLRAPMLSP